MCDFLSLELAGLKCTEMTYMQLQHVHGQQLGGS